MLKLHGKANVNGVMWVWDYANDKPMRESDMSKEQKKASDKAKGLILKDQMKELKNQ